MKEELSRQMKETRRLDEEVLVWGEGREQHEGVVVPVTNLQNQGAEVTVKHGTHSSLQVKSTSKHTHTPLVHSKSERRPLS